MQRNLLNFVVDTVVLLVLLGLLATGLLVRWVLPPASRGGGLTVWGWTRHDWGDLHFWLAVALVSLLVLHIALHWGWVCAVFRLQILRIRDVARRPSAARLNLYGLALVVVVAGLVGGFLWLASASVARGLGEERDRPERGRGGGWRGGRGARVEPAIRDLAGGMRAGPGRAAPAGAADGAAADAR